MNVPDKPLTYISIETSAFSGATLLARLLGGHPQIATVGEVNGLVDRVDPDCYACSCEQPIRTCPFWKAVTAAMAARGFAFDVADFNMDFVLNGPAWMQQLREGSSHIRAIDTLRDQLLYALPGQARQLNTAVSRNVAFIESVLAVSGARVFVDSAKDRMRLKALWRLSDLDVRAIHLVRDVGGVVASRLRREPDHDPAVVAADWRKLHRRVEVTLQQWPPQQVMRLRYEDLCRDPESVLPQLFAFCGVEKAVSLNDLLNRPQHIVGNPMRLQPLTRIRLDERWKQELTHEQLHAICRVAAPVRRRHGYAS